MKLSASSPRLLFSAQKAPLFEGQGRLQIKQSCRVIAATEGLPFLTQHFYYTSLILLGPSVVCSSYSRARKNAWSVHVST